jgi:preprotein translocase subunit YajC
MDQYIYYIFLGVMVVGLYFLMIRPDNKRKKAVQQMRKEISVGDDVISIGGIVGKVVEVDNDKITIETGEDQVRIQIKNWAVSSRNGIDPNQPQPKTPAK